MPYIEWNTTMQLNNVISRDLVMIIESACV